MFTHTSKSLGTFQHRTVHGYLIPMLSSEQARSRLLDLLMSVAYFGIGFAPITALAISLFGFLPLSLSAWLLVAPAAVLALALGFRFPAYGRLALKGFMNGVIAVTVYDAVRAPFVITGIWGDFIPKIGQWLLNSQSPNWLLGYLYRYVGDGGGMGMAFTVAYVLLRPRLRCWVAAVSFGVAIWACLLMTLLLAPDGQTLMFRLTPTSFGLSLLGHLVYGATLGIVLTRSKALFQPSAVDAHHTLAIRA